MVALLNVLAENGLLVGLGLGAGTIALLGGVYLRLGALNRQSRLDRELEEARTIEVAEGTTYDYPELEGELVELEPPDLRGAMFGWVGELLRTWRYLKKRKKLLDRGYVQWILVDDSYPWPRFVKPARKGGGIPELKYKGEHYLFPKESAIPDAKQGFWTIAHRKGEADPINLRDPDELSIPTDELTEYLETRISIGPPSWLDKLDMDVSDMLMYGIAAIIAYALLKGFLGGGIV